ncbi:MAG: (d)CMP kinase [Chlamydiales bacterium]|nr:(d)CMP kinase [Chlamydiales bacterium]
MIITIDGPGGSGKSTIAKKVADILHFEHIDTGAMYRAIAWYLKQQDIDIEDDIQLKKALQHCHLEVQSTDKCKKYIVNKQDVSQVIRTVEITNIVSIIAANPIVRHFLVQKQREVAFNKNVVCEGRDIGSVVFPLAELKIYLDADIFIRAERRYKELREKFPMKHKEIILDNILQDLIERDTIDSTRSHSPLCRPKDAILIDTSQLSIEEVIEKIIQLQHEIKKK